MADSDISRKIHLKGYKQHSQFPILFSLYTYKREGK